MTTFTVPKTITKGDDLIIISRKRYKYLLRYIKILRKSIFDNRLDEAIAEVKQGKTTGPFSNAKDLITSLQS